MPRYRIRTIKPEFYSDERVLAMPEPARYTAVGLISYADDRGRGQLLISQIKGLIHPGDDVTEKQVSKRLEAIFQTGFALAYETLGRRYLWLPMFWHHQVINKPSESQLPTPPDDPYGHLLITQAFAQFREDSRSGAVVLPPSRVRGRSDPFLSVVEVTDEQGGGKPAREPTKRVDQTQLPETLPAELHGAAQEAFVVLAAVHDVRGGDEPTVRGVGLAIDRFRNRDHIAVVRDLEHWATAGRGRNQEVKDWARTFATFLRKAPAGTATKPADGHAPAVNGGVGPAEHDQTRERRAAALRDAIERGTI